MWYVEDSIQIEIGEQMVFQGSAAHDSRSSRSAPHYSRICIPTFVQSNITQLPILSSKSNADSSIVHKMFSFIQTVRFYLPALPLLVGTPTEKILHVGLSALLLGTAASVQSPDLQGRPPRGAVLSAGVAARQESGIMGRTSARQTPDRDANHESDHATDHVAVVGGGVSGLVAAHKLLARGFQVTVVEARAELGGRVRTVSPPEFKGWCVPMGAEFVHGRDEEVWALMAEVGVCARQGRGSMWALMVCTV